jgi:hypothetical protein
MQIVPASVLVDISRHYLDHRSRREASWIWHSGDGKGKGGAIPFAADALYRGQNTRHTPMLASIVRELQSTDIGKISEASFSDQAKIVLRLAQSWWFGKELTRHPIFEHAASQNLDLNEIALAQHYGMSTGYLDLSDNFNVSAFFATCHETNEGWQPLDSGVGVIYRVIPRNTEGTFDRYIPLGPQKLPRPYEQCAWVVEMPLCHGFEGWPGVEMLLFHHNHQVGKYFLDLFDGGAQLFPPDPLADIAGEILSCGEIPVDLVEAIFESLLNDPSGILASDLPVVRREISSLVSLIDYRQLLTDQHVASLCADPDWTGKMLSAVTAGAIAIRRVEIQQDATQSAVKSERDIGP